MRDFGSSADPAVQAQLDRLAALSVPQGRLGLDTIRALHTSSFPSKAALDEMLYADWLGRSKITPEMADGANRYAGKDSYKNEFVLSKWASFVMTDARAGQYDYVAYFNVK